MFEIIISKEDGRKSKIVFAQEFFSSPKYIHYRNITLKRGKDHSQHPRLLFFYSICQKFCSWHNALILLNLCSLKPAMNLIISVLGFKHTVFIFILSCSLRNTTAFSKAFSGETQLQMDGVMESPSLGSELVHAGAWWNMA